VPFTPIDLRFTENELTFLTEFEYQIRPQNIKQKHGLSFTFRASFLSFLCVFASKYGYLSPF
jgi:hypothetical protein